MVLVVRNPPANTGHMRDAGLIPGLGRTPGGGAWQPTPVFSPGEFHGQRSIVGYSPWDHKDSDTTEQLTVSVQFSCILYLFPSFS